MDQGVCTSAKCASRSTGKINFRLLAYAFRTGDRYPLETSSADVALVAPASVAEQAVKLSRKQAGIDQTTCPKCGNEEALLEPPMTRTLADGTQVTERPIRCTPCWRAARAEKRALTTALLRPSSPPAPKPCRALVLSRVALELYANRPLTLRDIYEDGTCTCGMCWSCDPLPPPPAFSPSWPPPARPASSLQLPEEDTPMPTPRPHRLEKSPPPARPVVAKRPKLSKREQLERFQAIVARQDPSYQRWLERNPSPKFGDGKVG